MPVSGTHGSEGPFVSRRRIENWTSDRIYRGSGLALVCDRAVVGSKNETETCSGNGGFGGENEYHKSFDENKDEEVIIVGTGASGLAIAACFTDLGISSLVLDRYFCVGSLWKNRTYDRQTLQGSKQHADFPLMPVLDEYPMFLTRDHFVAYLEKYARRFNIHPQFCQSVESASFTQETRRWHVIAKCSSDNSEREYHGRFLVVVTGKFNENVVPDVPGLDITMQGRGRLS